MSLNYQLCKKKFKVAVLLAAYNGRRWIEEQLNSILNQENVNVEIFISVDLSTDQTYEFVKSLEKKNKSIITLPYGVRFGDAAKNFYRLIKDVKIDQYDFIALADQDDIWLAQKLNRAINIINDKKCDAFSSDTIAFWENGREKYSKKSFLQKKYDYLFEAAGPGCTYVFSSKSLINFKNFLLLNWHSINNVFFHDWMIYAFFRTHKYNWYIDSLPLIKYRQHSNNATGLNLGLKAYLKRFKFVNNKLYRKEVETIKSLLKLNISINLWFRIKNFLQLRRRLRDAFALLILSILGLY